MASMGVAVEAQSLGLTRGFVGSLGRDPHRVRWQGEFWQFQDTSCSTHPTQNCAVSDRRGPVGTAQSR